MKPSGTTGTTTDMHTGPGTREVRGDQGRSINRVHKTASAAVLGEITPPSGARCGAGRRCFVVDASLSRTTKRLINDAATKHEEIEMDWTRREIEMLEARVEALEARLGVEAEEPHMTSEELLRTVAEESRWW